MHMCGGWQDNASMKNGTWDIKAFGAVGDGKTLNTGAIQYCIDECSKQGGGTVLINGGVFVSGTLFLKSHVTLEITASGILLASPDIKDYSEHTHYNRYRNEPDMDRCFLYAQDQENIGLRGTGRIEGNAESFPNEGNIYRPMMMRFLRCSGILLEGLRLNDAAAWSTAFLDSVNIRVRNVQIHNEKRYNGDGLDFDGCSHVFVDGCTIVGTDDNLCLQAGSREYPVEDVHISNCEFTSICAAVRIGLKSIGDIRNVTITNCTMKNVWREGIKIECTEGGNISDIVVNNVVMRNVSRPVFVILNNRYFPDGLGSSLELTHMPEIGTMSRLSFCNIIAVDDEEMKNTHYRFGKDIMGSPSFNGIRFDAEEKHPIEKVTLQNVMYHSIGGVKQEDIPKEYPRVPDLLREEQAELRGLEEPENPNTPTGWISENYYPDWSRTAFLDIRNVRGLYLGNVNLQAEYEDERTPWLLEGCKLLREEIFVEPSNK